MQKGYKMTTREFYQAVANSSDIRKDKTEPIKAAIANGTYNVSNDDFASKLLAKYEEKLSF